MSTPTAAAVYLRISQDRNGEALGVERQRADCVTVAERRGLEVIDEYRDNDRSAYNGKRREQWDRLLADLAAGRIDSVVAWANDRLYRRVEDQLLLMRAVAARGGVIATVKDGDVDPGTAEGEMRMTILASVAQFEGRRKGERQRAKAAENARAGRTNGGGMRPYGYTEGGLVVDDQEAENLREAARRVVGGESTYQIAEDWRERGIKTVAGAEWSHRSLGRTLRLARIAGLREYDGEVYLAVWPAILPRRTWDAVQRRLAQRPAEHRRGGGRRTYLLTGFLICGRCGAPMRGHPVHGKRSYGCMRESGGCGRMRIVAEPTEQVIAEAVFSAIDGGAVNRALAAASQDSASADVLEQIAADRAALEQLSRDHYVDDRISREEFLAAREGLSARIVKAEQQLARSEQKAVLAGMSSGDVARTAWETWETSRRRELLHALIERIRVAPATAHVFEASRLGIAWRA